MLRRISQKQLIEAGAVTVAHNHRVTLTASAKNYAAGKIDGRPWELKYLGYKGQPQGWQIVIKGVGVPTTAEHAAICECVQKLRPWLMEHIDEPIHVPGPWIVDEVNTPNGVSYFINHLWEGSDDYEDGTVTHTDEIAEVVMDYKYDVALRNARVLAAAPELLHAAKMSGGGPSFLEEHGRLCWCACRRTNIRKRNCHSTCCNLMDDAVAKAEGRAS